MDQKCRPKYRIVRFFCLNAENRETQSFSLSGDRVELGGSRAAIHHFNLKRIVLVYGGTGISAPVATEPRSEERLAANVDLR